MAGRTMVVTGATGFIGRNLIAALHHEYRVWAISRGTPSLRGVSLPASVRWLPADIAVGEDIAHAFETIAADGGADIVVHLAGHYDFSGERDPEYERTNVHGMRNVLEHARRVGARDVYFSSSVAACEFPRRGAVLDESSPPDGSTPYAESKRAGEEMMVGYRDSFRCWTIRFAALVSDWGEYEPVYRFLECWLSRHPRRRILAGCGESAVPYLHVRDAVAMFRRLLARREQLDPDVVVIASPDGSTSHRALFEAATAAQSGQRERPILMPRPLCAFALHVRDALGRLTGSRAFERPWMSRMIDRRLDVDARRTRRRLGWTPRPRLGILRRMPFLIENRKAFALEWHRRNHEALRSIRRHDNLEVHRLFQRRFDSIEQSLTKHVFEPAGAVRFRQLRELGPERQRADDTLLLEALDDAVRTGEKAVFQHACRQIAERRRREGFDRDEIIAVLNALNYYCRRELTADDDGVAWTRTIHDHITMTVQFGIDEIYDVFEGVVRART